MDVKGKVILVTGGGNGIGRALCEKFRHHDARAIAVVDIDGDKAHDVAAGIDGIAIAADVSQEADVIRAVQQVQAIAGPIDMYCSNAGILRTDPDFSSMTSCSNEQWQSSWNVNVMAHVYAARAVVPGMIERGGGCFLITASAAGLLSLVGSGPYSATKHAAIGFAESLAITHGDDGILVLALCPQAVDTQMVNGFEDGLASVDGILSADDVANHVIDGLDKERFLVLPHPQVSAYFKHKAADYDRWLSSMRSLRRQFSQAGTLSQR